MNPCNVKRDTHSLTIVGKTPWVQKGNGRLCLSAITAEGKKTSISYPKYLYETRHQCCLLPGQTVDHIDGDFYNNSDENLQVLTVSENTAKDALAIVPQTFICPVCGFPFTLEGEYLRQAAYNRKRIPSASGPYCSDRCSGIASHWPRRERVYSPIYYTVVHRSSGQIVQQEILGYPNGLIFDTMRWY